MLHTCPSRTLGCAQFVKLFDCLRVNWNIRWNMNWQYKSRCILVYHTWKGIWFVLSVETRWITISGRLIESNGHLGRGILRDFTRVWLASTQEVHTHWNQHSLSKFYGELFNLSVSTSKWMRNNSESKKYRNQNCFIEFILCELFVNDK